MGCIMFGRVAWTESKWQPSPSSPSSLPGENVISQFPYGLECL